jgi:DNA-binding transcriptional ArsR family regulator
MRMRLVIGGGMATAETVNPVLIALRHPTRREILRLIQERSSISPRELSAELHGSLSNISYHVQVLVVCGAVQLVGPRQVRGSMEHFYKFTIEEDWALTVLDNDPAKSDRPSS